jgi:ATP-dependent RNA helicase DeaD
MLVFARTKQSTVELVEKLEARGFAAAALNGDILQAQRERTIAALKSGKIDIVVATDVAARGIDVERITHVVNFDVPYDSESYVHRIGRTGRAGRSGEAILFISARERNILRIIERATRQPIEPMALPTVQEVNARRAEKFKKELSEMLESEELSAYRGVIEEFVRESGADVFDVAAALASLAKSGRSLFVTKRAEPTEEVRESVAQKVSKPRRPEGPQAFFRLEVGRRHGVQPGNIVGALAHEGDMHGSEINGIDIRDDHTIVRLPAQIPDHVLKHLAGIVVRGQPLAIKRIKADKKGRGSRY